MRDEKAKEMLARIQVITGQLQLLSAAIVAEAEQEGDGAGPSAVALSEANGGAEAEVRAVAEEYLAALASGDAATANRIGRVNVEHPHNGFLTPAVFAAAVPLCDPEVLSIHLRPVDGSGAVREAMARIVYEVAKESFNAMLTITRDAKGWFVSDGLTFSSPTMTQYDFSFSGATGSANTIGRGKMYPGVYTVTAPNAFFDMTGSLTVAVVSNLYSLPDSDIAMEPNAAHVDAVQQAVNARFEECLTGKGTLGELRKTGVRLLPRKVSHLDTAFVTSLTILEYPIVSVVSGETGGRQFTVSDGQAIVELTGKNWRGEVETEDVPATSSMYVRSTIVGGAVKVRIQ